jgi:hypothetical protein
VADLPHLEAVTVSLLRPFAAGTVLSCAAVAGLATQDPGPAEFPPVSFRHPREAYLGLAAAPFGNGWELLALVALICSACLFTWGLRDARHRDREREP